MTKKEECTFLLYIAGKPPPPPLLDDKVKYLNHQQIVTASSQVSPFVMQMNFNTKLYN